MTKITISDHELDYDTSEAYKSLRTNLQFCGADKKVIVFTSCTPDEGKSTVVRSLAISLAEAGKKVLLIDADLRKSAMAGSVEISEPVKGLTHFLSGQAEEKDVICETNLENLHVILAGPVPPNPAELLGTAGLKGLLDWSRENYDFVLIDSAPLGVVIDSAIIAEKCDGAVIVIEVEVISYRFVQEIGEQLEKAGCPVLGTILNKADLRKRGYYSHYRRQYGKKYGKYYGYGSYGRKKK